MIRNILGKVVNGENLSEEEAMKVMDFIMEGRATSAQVAGLLAALKTKGETVDEITGFVRSMKNKAIKVDVDEEYCIDTCGTGGDGLSTFNISTASAFVVAAGGCKVAKHGNRSITSQCGSADVLEALGINIELNSYEVKECIKEVGIGFMFAPIFHSSMRYAAGPRRELGIRTVFNILGPLTNPAQVKGQILGVFAPELTEFMGHVLIRLGIERGLVVYGMDGMDEISPFTHTKVTEIRDGEIITYEISPENFGLERKEGHLIGGDAVCNAQIIMDIFKGQRDCRRDAVILNSAGALYVGKAVDSISDGIEMASEIIDSGAAYNKIMELASFTRRYGR